MQASKPTGRTQRSIASSETAREINRGILLHSIHLRQPVSRADLARITGLQPSTVSAITGQLIDEGWVLAGEQGRLPRGRRPTYLMLNDRHATLAIDLRPGYANLAVVDINGKLLAREQVSYAPDGRSTEQRAKTALDKMIRAGRALRAAHGERFFAGLGVSVAGRVEQKTHRLLFSPNAPWGQIDLYAALERELGGPVEMDNAANACLFAERWFGNFNEAANLLVVSVSEGIGTGLLIDGRVARGHDGMAGEFGHMMIEADGPVCGCGKLGCWESFASNRAALRYYSELAPKSALLSFSQLLELAGAGDGKALCAIDKMTEYLARGLAMLTVGLAPEAIIVVGDCTALWPRIQPKIERELAARSIAAHRPRVAAAMDGDAARLRGAAALVLHKALFGEADFAPDSVRKSEGIATARA